MRGLYNRLCDAVRFRRAFALYRFCDGEMKYALADEWDAEHFDEPEACIKNGVGVHKYYPDLSHRLREILEDLENEEWAILGINWEFYSSWEPIRKFLWQYDIMCHEGTVFHKASKYGLLLYFFKALLSVTPDILLVGNRQWRNWNAKAGGHWFDPATMLVSVPPRGGWEYYFHILKKLNLLLQQRKKHTVVLFACGAMSNVFIYDIRKLFPGNTYLNIGSALDPYCGVLSRRYMRRTPEIARLKK